MRHKVTFRKLSRGHAHRRAMLRNLATSLLECGSCHTTLPRAKELRRVVEPLIALARNDNLHARKKAHAFLFNKQVVKKLFADIGPRFRSRKGGYTRLVRTGYRHGDAAQMAVIELLAEVNSQAQAKSTEEKKGEKSAAAAGKEKKPRSAVKKDSSAKAKPKAARAARA